MESDDEEEQVDQEEEEVHGQSVVGARLMMAALF